MSWKLNAFMALDHLWCHKLKLPGGRWICDRLDAWVMRGPWDDEPPPSAPVWRPDQLLGAKYDPTHQVELRIVDWEPLEHGPNSSKTEETLENPSEESDSSSLLYFPVFSSRQRCS